MKRDCLLFSVNVKMFFAFFVMREKANYLLRETVFRRGIGDPLIIAFKFSFERLNSFACISVDCVRQNRTRPHFVQIGSLHVFGIGKMNRDCSL